DWPEGGFWANLVDHQATRRRLDRLGMGLAEVERVLAELVGDRRVDARRAALSRMNRAALDRPVLDSGEAPAGVRIPALGESYLDPDFRVAEVGPSDRPAEESWWDERPVRSDLTGFLLRHIPSPAHGAPARVRTGQRPPG